MVAARGLPIEGSIPIHRRLALMESGQHGINVDRHPARLKSRWGCARACRRVIHSRSVVEWLANKLSLSAGGSEV